MSSQSIIFVGINDIPLPKNRLPMKKSILILSSFLLLCSMPSFANEATIDSEPSAEISARPEASISIDGRNVRVQNAQGSVLEIFSITGKKVATFRIDTNDKTVTVNANKGCYIAKLGGLTRKIYLN